MPAVPEILKNPVLLQQILSKLSAETDRANSAERQVADLKVNVEDWKKAAQAQEIRAKTLDEALAARREEAIQLRTANGFIMTSLGEYKSEVSDLRKENDRLRASRKWYLIGGAVIGGGISVAARR